MRALPGTPVGSHATAALIGFQTTRNPNRDVDLNSLQNGRACDLPNTMISNDGIGMVRALSGDIYSLYVALYMALYAVVIWGLGSNLEETKEPCGGNITVAFVFMVNSASRHFVSMDPGEDEGFMGAASPPSNSAPFTVDLPQFF